VIGDLGDLVGDLAAEGEELMFVDGVWGKMDAEFGSAGNVVSKRAVGDASRLIPLPVV